MTDNNELTRHAPGYLAKRDAESESLHGLSHEIMIPEFHVGRITCFWLGEDELLTGGADGTLRVWSPSTLDHLAKIILPRSCEAMDVCADGGQVLMGGGPGTAHLVDRETGRECQRFVGHRGQVNSVCLHEDKGLAITGCYDGKVRIFDLSSGKERDCWDVTDQEVVHVSDRFRGSASSQRWEYPLASQCACHGAADGGGRAASRALGRRGGSRHRHRERFRDGRDPTR